MKRKKLLMLLGSVCLALMLAVPLVAGACAKAAPEGVAEKEIAALESKLAAEKAKTEAAESNVSELEKEIAALKKPAEVLTWAASTWTPAGASWTALCSVADSVESMSDGRLIVDVSAPGGVCPVEGHLDAISAGTLDMALIWSGYFRGALPVTACHSGTYFSAPKMAGETRLMTVPELCYLFEDFEDGKIMELLREEYARYGDVYLVGNFYWTADTVLATKVPIYGTEDLQGVKIRSSSMSADLLNEFGAATVWLPGPEIYTALATGAVDGETYSNAKDNLDMSFHEVTKYWLKKPTWGGSTTDGFIVTASEWQALPDDLKAITETAIDAATGGGFITSERETPKAWETAKSYGIEIIEWSDEDCAVWLEVVKSLVAEGFRVDAASNEFVDIVDRFFEVGY